MSKKAYTLGGQWNKKDEADIQNWILVYQSKANLDGKILFGAYHSL